MNRNPSHSYREIKSEIKKQRSTVPCIINLSNNKETLAQIKNLSRITENRDKETQNACTR